MCLLTVKETAEAEAVLCIGQLGNEITAMTSEEQLPPWAVKDEIYESGDWRSIYKHDIDEIVYKPSFRKLAQKTQVVVQPSNETFRTRLTHTLEVAQIADNFGAKLSLNRGLIRAIAFAHDLGHPPFAHVGERTLDRLLKQHAQRAAESLGAEKEDAEKLAKCYGFSHPQNSRQILQRKMKRISNLTLCSVVGHNWSPWKDCRKLRSLKDVEEALLKPLSTETSDPNSAQFLPCYEAQAVALSDQIAALNSDVEDLIFLETSSSALQSEAKQLLERTRLCDAEKDKVEEILRQCIRNYEEPEEMHRGWGRRSRLGLSVNDIISASIDRVRSQKAHEDLLSLSACAFWHHGYSNGRSRTSIPNAYLCPS